MRPEEKILVVLVALGIVLTFVGGDVGSGALTALLIAALVAGVIWVRKTFAAPAEIFLEDSPEQAIDFATSYMAHQGYTVAHKGDRTVTFSRPKKPRADTGCLLLLLGIIPGLLYFGLFKGTYTVSLVAVPRSDGSRLVISGDDHEGRRMLSRM